MYTHSRSLISLTDCKWIARVCFDSLAQMFDRTQSGSLEEAPRQKEYALEELIRSVNDQLGNERAPKRPLVSMKTKSTGPLSRLLP